VNQSGQSQLALCILVTSSPLHFPVHLSFKEKVLCFLIVSGTTLRFLLPFWRNPLESLTSDPLRHWNNAGKLFSPTLMGGSDPIVYQAFLWMIRTAIQDSHLAFACLAGVLSATMPWFYFRAAREFGSSRMASLTIWAFIAVTPSLFVIFNYVMMETILLPLVGLALWASAYHLRKQSLQTFWISGGLWALACLTKPTILPLAAACVLWTWWQTRRRVLAGLGLTAIAVVMILPSTIRSASVLGFYAPVGNPWITKIQHRSGANKIAIHFKDEHWNFVSPSCNMLPLAPLSPWRIRRGTEDTRVVVYVEADRGAETWKATFEQLPVTANDWLAQWGENIVLFLFAPSWPDCNMNQWDGWLAVASRWLWAPIIFFILDCNIRDFLKRRFDLLPVATTIFTLFLMFQNVATSEGRYRKPLEPLLIMNLVIALRPSIKGSRHSSEKSNSLNASNVI